MKKTAKNSTVSKRGVLGEGKPRIVIPYEQVRKLARLQCTQQEIADYLDMSVDTLQRDERFNELYRRGMNHGRMSVRRAQYRKMLQGDGTMLVWLGKQYLGQRDPDKRLELTGAGGAPLIPEIKDDLELGRRAAFMLTMEAITKAKRQEAEDA